MKAYHRLGAVFVIVVLLLSSLLIVNADTSENKTKNILNGMPKSLSDEDFDWSKIEVISEPVFGQNFNTKPSLFPTFAVEGDNIYVVWTDGNNTDGSGEDNDIFYRYFNGNIWADIQVISEPIPGQNLSNRSSSGPMVEVENGKIYVVWTSGNNTNNAGPDADIFYRCNLTGSGWEDIQVISEPVPGQNFNSVHTAAAEIEVENGKIYVCWGDENNTNGAGTDYDIFYRCNLTGSGWEDIQVISEPVPGQNFNTGVSTAVYLAVEDGRIYTIWDCSNNTNGAGTDYDIFYRCNLTGSSWEPIQVISEPVFGQNFNTEESKWPDIAVENGKVYVTWMDKNNTNGCGGGASDQEIFYRCNLSGSSWSSIQVISEPVYGQNFNTGYASWVYMVVDNYKIHVVWQDQNNTNGAGGGEDDIFYRWKQISSLFLRSPRVTPSLGNTSTEFNFTVDYYQLNNNSPTSVKIIINSTEYSMVEVNPGDSNYANGKKYYFKIKNLDIGTYTYKFNASDGINYTITKLFGYVEVFNTGPQIITDDNLTAIEDEYYEVTYEFEDIDIANVDQACHWEFATNASWLNFNLATGELNGTPRNDEVGQYWVDIAVNDSIEIVDTNFTLTVIDVNDDPIIITSNVEITNEDELYEVQYNATDIDSLIENQIWLFETNASTWINISSSNGILNGTPENNDVGKYWINISVIDNEGGFDFTNYTLTVINVNDNPEIFTEDVLLAETDKLYEVDYNATDIDSAISQLIWSLETNASWLEIDPSSGLLKGTPTRNDAGLFNVNISISDGDGGIDWHEFIITVYKGNLPPIIITEDIKIAKVNESYEVEYNATDDDPLDWLTWSFISNASWLSFDSTTGVLSGTPIKNDGRHQYWINISVIDGELAFDYHNFTIQVLKESKTTKNKSPKLSNFELIPSYGDTKTEFTFSVHYFNADNDPPTIIQVVIDDNPYNMDLRTGEIVYNGYYDYITTLSEGRHKYYFTSSDDSDSNTSDTFTTPYIEKPVRVDGDGADKEGLTWEWLIVIIIIIIVVVLIIAFFMIRRKKKPEEEEEIIPPTQPEISTLEVETVPSPAPPVTPTPPQEYDVQEPAIKEDIYPTAPEESTIDVTLPEDTTTPQLEPEQGFEPYEQPKQAPEEEGVEELEE